MVLVMEGGCTGSRELHLTLVVWCDTFAACPL